jgi:hypothetical protein
MLEINEKSCQKNERLFKQFHTLYLTRGEKLIVMKAINDNHSQSMAIIGNQKFYFSPCLHIHFLKVLLTCCVSFSSVKFVYSDFL